MNMNNNVLKMKKNFKFVIMFGLMIFALITCGNKQEDAKDALNQQMEIKK